MFFKGAVGAQGPRGPTGNRGPAVSSKDLMMRSRHYVNRFILLFHIDDGLQFAWNHIRFMRTSCRFNTNTTFEWQTVFFKSFIFSFMMVLSFHSKYRNDRAIRECFDEFY